MGNDFVYTGPNMLQSVAILPRFPQYNHFHNTHSRSKFLQLNAKVSWKCKICFIDRMGKREVKNIGLDACERGKNCQVSLFVSSCLFLLSPFLDLLVFSFA